MMDLDWETSLAQGFFISGAMLLKILCNMMLESVIAILCF